MILYSFQKSYHLNIPFHFLSIEDVETFVLNIIITVPFGFLVPILYKCDWRKIIVSGMRTHYRMNILCNLPIRFRSPPCKMCIRDSSVGEGISERIFYLTAKTITRTVAGEAFEILKKAAIFRLQ